MGLRARFTFHDRSEVLSSETILLSESQDERTALAPSGGRFMTAISVFLLLCLAGVFVLAMRRAPMWGWAAGLAAAVLVWRTGLIYGDWHEPPFNLLGLLAWVPVGGLAGLSLPP